MSGPPVRQDRGMSPDAADVLAAEDARYQAMLDADLDALDRLCADAPTS